MQKGDVIAGRDYAHENKIKEIFYKYNALVTRAIHGIVSINILNHSHKQPGDLCISKANVVVVNKRCPVCNEGFMHWDRSTPKCLDDGFEFMHKCTNCGVTEEYLRTYPYVAFEY